jgi:tetratricopeptide (TPR) repeat protein
LAKDIHKVYNSMGITYDEKSDYPNAITYYNLCIEKCPSYHSAYYNLAIVYKSEGNTAKAI